MDTKEIDKLVKGRYYQKKDKKNDSQLNVNDWLEFSTKPQDENEIIKRVKQEMEESSLGKYVCISYLCRYSPLSEECIEKLNKLTSYRVKVKRTDIGKNGKVKHKVVWETGSRIDWKYICQYQKLSESFIERHENDVLWDLIYRFQDVSNDFKMRNIEHYKREQQLSMLKDQEATLSTSNE